jgi:hypothetical protein
VTSMTATNSAPGPKRRVRRSKPNPLHLAGEPSAAELAAIEDEWPLIEAELAVVDAEIRLLNNDGGPSPLDWRRLRRAEARVLRLAAELGATTDETVRGWSA